MTNTDHTPSEEHDHSITLESDFDDYGLHQQEDATTVIRIDHDTHIFERVGKMECRSTGVVLKKHIRLQDKVVGDIAEAFEPIQFASASSEDFEERLQDAVFDLVYDGKVLEEVARGLSAELVESMSGQYSDGSTYS